MSTDFRPAQAALARFGPLLVGIAVAVAGFLWFVQPALSNYLQGRTDVSSVEARVRAMQDTMTRRGSQPTADDAVALKEFDRVTAIEDRVPEIVELFARNALDSAPKDKVRNLAIEAGERMQLTRGPQGNAPRVADDNRSDQPDPRVALFTSSLEYTPVTVSFESTHEAIGNFLWRLRDLPTTVEVRTLELTRGLPLMKIKLTALVYRRTQPSEGVVRVSAPASITPPLVDQPSTPNPLIPRTKIPGDGTLAR